MKFRQLIIIKFNPTSFRRRTDVGQNAVVRYIKTEQTKQGCSPLLQPPKETKPLSFFLLLHYIISWTLIIRSMGVQFLPAFTFPYFRLHLRLCHQCLHCVCEIPDSHYYEQNPACNHLKSVACQHNNRTRMLLLQEKQRFFTCQSELNPARAVLSSKNPT